MVDASFLKNMRCSGMKRTLSTLLGVIVCCLGLTLSALAANADTHAFSVSDDIQLAILGGITHVQSAVVFSPDGRWFVVETERGRPDLNAVEDSLRFYRAADVLAFMKVKNRSDVPLPTWILNRTADKGPVIVWWRWLPDSSGLAFLEGDGDITAGDKRLVLADLRRKTTELLTSATEGIDQFDVRDRKNYVYTSVSLAQQGSALSAGPAVVGTSHNLYELILPDESVTKEGGAYSHTLWAVVNGKRFQVKHDGAAVFPVPRGYAPQGLAISPDGRAAIAALPVAEVPTAWETRYPPPFQADPSRIRAGEGTAYQWVRIDLQTGSVQSLTDAPMNPQGSWGWMFAGPSWSSDGEAVLLPGTFIERKDNVPSRPCVAVVDLISDTRTCVEVLKGRTETGTENGFHHIHDARFVGGDKRRVRVQFRNHDDVESFGATDYEWTTRGGWQVVSRVDGNSALGRNGLAIGVKEGLNVPPLVVATYAEESRTIWDPNPQLKSLGLGQVTVYRWRDKGGRQWKGGLFKPSDYKPRQRYPLVIQTHGFTESKFIPSGTFPTAFAAQEFAAAGILVLQAPDAGICPSSTADEGPCNALGYESAAKQLVSEGVVDPEKVGIIGFSRTCYSVMELLTTSPLHLQAASVTAGVMANYLQYMMLVDWQGNSHAQLYDSLIGSRPFSNGLKRWLARSPDFNLDKVTAPLLVVAEGRPSVLFMWEAYAGLRYLNKPVELVMLKTDEHVLTNPAVRLASQGGSLDWFRFWLQGYEDSDPPKAEQYQRWETLCDMQRAQNPGQPAFCVGTKH
jgi:dipeptidyl aminopeptidase/acylaminoacyl peptidase